MAVGDTAADAEGFGEGESGQGMDAGANVPDSGVEGGGREAYASNTAAVIDATMQQAKDMEQSRENFDPMGSAHKGKFDYYGGVDMDSMFGQPTGAKPAFTDAQYRDKGWVPGKALTYTDEHGKTQLATLEAHENKMDLADLETLRQKAYAAKASQQGWNVPFFGKVSNQQIAQQAMAMLGGPVTSLGMGALSAISVPYDARVSGTAAERAALGYYGPGYPTGLPNIGPHMKDVDRNWDDARWSDNYSSDAFTLGQTVDHQGNKMNAPTSPAGGEVITVAAPPGAPDQRVTQFKALYPEDWTETLTDEEIIEMVENPDQLRYWLSWRQT